MNTQLDRVHATCQVDIVRLEIGWQQVAILVHSILQQRLSRRGPSVGKHMINLAKFPFRSFEHV